MDRAKFLANQRMNAVKFSPLTLPGFDEPVYIRPLSMADVKTQMLKTEEPPTVGERLAKDQFYIERSIARILHDENGALLFDEFDDVQMAELKAVVDASSNDFTTLIHDAQGKLGEPDKTEVDPKGN